MKNGFESPTSDPCVHIYQESDNVYRVKLYVDDVLLLGKDTNILENIKREPARRSLMTDVGDVAGCLGWSLLGTAEKEKGRFVFLRIA